MFLTCCFYVGLAFLGIYFVGKYQKNNGIGKPSLNEQLIAQDRKIGTEDGNQNLIEKKDQNEGSLEAFILKEIEKSVKNLEKREPFASIDVNVTGKKFNPQVEDYVPKGRLNPFAQDFYPVFK